WATRDRAGPWTGSSGGVAMAQSSLSEPDTAGGARESKKPRGQRGGITASRPPQPGEGSKALWQYSLDRSRCSQPQPSHGVSAHLRGGDGGAGNWRATSGLGNWVPALGRAVPAHRMRAASQLRENSQGSPWYAACSIWAVMVSALFGTYAQTKRRAYSEAVALLVN